ncbi:hypothetical protein MTR67_052753 [Solanum verrucosum]|uniref:Late blight resistance protein n=1 Tax=Solanum verrucosum TaxID=315347 RepID=A0AAF0V9Q1_SOLVR|nr:hypothetical protein MTR67_052753 [Solanum verrucosum]
MQVSEVAGATDGHHPRTVGPTVRSGGPWMATCSPSQKQSRNLVRVHPRRDLWTIGQAMVRGPGSWVSPELSLPESPLKIWLRVDPRQDLRTIG